MATYSNLPPADTAQSNATLKAFDNYYSQPVELSSSVLAAMKAYFTSRGFGEVSAESISITIMTQAKQDGYNPMQILDTLKGLNNLQLSGIVSEVLNYNRFKSSSLGYAQKFIPNTEIQRTIIDGYYTTTPTTTLYNESGELLSDELGKYLTTE